MELNDNERLILSLALQGQIVAAQMLLQKLNPQGDKPPQEDKPLS
jgi:hypothetical protein